MNTNETKKEEYSQVLKYTGLFGGIQGLGIVASIVRNKLTAMILGPSGIGLIALFTSVVNFVSQSTNLGISTSAVKHISESSDDLDSEAAIRFVSVVRFWSLITAALGMIVCATIGPLLSKWMFAWGDHTLHFVLLSPAVGALAITGGETAILKGARCLRSLAFTQLLAVLTALLVSIPIYFLFGEAGIVPVMVALATFTMCVTLHYSFKRYPFKRTFNRSMLAEGIGMVRLGIAFVLSGMLGSGAEMIIRSFLNNYGSPDFVGLYSAGFLIVVTYSGMVFSSMETDFFPRLSGVSHDNQQVNITVNRQIEVSVLIVTPMLMFLAALLPVLVPLFYSSKFVPVVEMAQVTIMAMFFRAIVLPMEYINLAKGKALAYLLLECTFDVIMATLVIIGCEWLGLVGTGIALDVAYFLNLAIVLVFNRIKYGCTLSAQAFKYSLIHFLLLSLLLFVIFECEGWAYWGASISLFALSSVFSLWVLHSKTSLWTKLIGRIKRKFAHE